MDETLRTAVARLADDARSGASELLPQVVAILRRAASRRGVVEEAARAICHAQPSMAPFWNAALAALADTRAAGGALDRFDQRARRAPAALARVAAATLSPVDGRALHVISWSYSGSVASCLRALTGAPPAGPRTLRVSCGEGRPAFEGRRLAEALARDGIAVECFTDGALACALAGRGDEERVVLVGADAVSPDWIVNKAGTRMLAAAAAHAGVPVYVAATRDKFVDPRVARLLRMVEREAAQVWDGPPAGVTVRNPCFEKVGLDLVTAVVTDAGTLTGAMIGEACRAASAGASDADIDRASAP
jgi:translation initiation factor 2B subunit (eIF-2B alpha/beta/delta family)